MEKLYELHAEAASTSSSSTPRRPATRSTSSTPPAAHPLPRPPRSTGCSWPRPGGSSGRSTSPPRPSCAPWPRWSAPRSSRTPSPSSRPSRAWRTASATGPTPCDALLSDDETALRAGGLTPTATPSRRRRSSPTRWPRPTSPCSALIVNRMHPRFGAGLAEAARRAGRHLAGTALGGLYANLADFQLVAAREEDHLAGPRRKVAPAPVVRVPFLAATSTTSPASSSAYVVAADLVPRASDGPALAAGAAGAGRRRRGRRRPRTVSVDRHDAVEAGGVEQAGERGTAAGDGDVAAGLPGPADAADERAEAGRVHERAPRRGRSAGRVWPARPRASRNWPDRVGVELTHRSTERVVGRRAPPRSRAQSSR